MNDTRHGKSVLGEFLSTRRAQLKPGDMGLPEYGERRRVPGLRREELAQLAGVNWALLRDGRATSSRRPPLSQLDKRHW